MSTAEIRSKRFARALVTLQIGSQILSAARRSTSCMKIAYSWLFRQARRIEGLLKFNPVAVLLLFPLVATPARFAKSQRKGLVASLVATGVLLWTAAGFWTSALQELTAKSLRMMEKIQPSQMNEISKQQFELMLSTIMGKPMGLVIATLVFLMACCRAAWYKGFIGLYYRSRRHRPIVGLHYFLVQSASNALYLGVLVYAACFAINNWAWLEEPVYRMVRSVYFLIPVLILGLIQNRYFRHKAKVDKQLYGSWLAELISTLAALVALVLGGCGLIWLLGLGINQPTVIALEVWPVAIVHRRLGNGIQRHTSMTGIAHFQRGPRCIARDKSYAKHGFALRPWLQPPPHSGSH